MGMQSAYSALGALKSSTDWLNRVGDNIANMNTVGFAQDQGTFADTLTMQLFGSATDPAQAARVTPQGWRGGTGVASVSEGRDFSGMTLQQTGKSLDFAIDGPGFFVVQGTNGPLYTKAGDFIWSARPDGRFQLATQTGSPVLTTTGQPIIESTNHQQISVGPNGQVSFGTKQGPKLAIAEINQPSSHLVAQGNNLYALGPGGQAQVAKSSSVRQGFLSYSNVDVAKQFGDMIQAQNMYQLNAESIQLTNRMEGVADSIKP